jgi:hypothetical protein
MIPEASVPLTDRNPGLFDMFPEPGAESFGGMTLFQDVHPRFSHLGIFRRLPPAHADGADALPVREDRQTTLPSGFSRKNLWMAE